MTPLCYVKYEGTTFLTVSIPLAVVHREGGKAGYHNTKTKLKFASPLRNDVSVSDTVGLVSTTLSDGERTFFNRF